MTVLPICIIGEPVLHGVSSPVTEFDDSLRTLVHDMQETMRLAPGVGLAAPQVGVNLALFVWQWDDREGVRHEGVVANPHLMVSPTIPRRVPTGEDSEGCLSVPGYSFPLSRGDKALLEGVDESGSSVTIHAIGWLARIFQHEFDHLLGTIYVERLGDPWREESLSAITDNDWGKPGQTWLPE